MPGNELCRPRKSRRASDGPKTSAWKATLKASRAVDNSVLQCGCLLQRIPASYRYPAVIIEAEAAVAIAGCWRVDCARRSTGVRLYAIAYAYLHPSKILMRQRAMRIAALNGWTSEQRVVMASFLVCVASERPPYTPEAAARFLIARARFRAVA
jgi:hypothetical protein